MRQEPISRRFRRSFYYASVPCSALGRSMMRATAPINADYSPLNSVVYLGFCMNPAGHDPEARKSKTAVTQNEREELLEAMLLDAPELTFPPRGDPDPASFNLRACSEGKWRVRTSRRRSKRGG
jgi:hypothetical protein